MTTTRRTILRFLASLPFLGSGLALLEKPAMAAGALKEGFAIMRIGSDTVTVDTRNFRPVAGQKAVVCRFDGSLSIEPVIFEDWAPWYGERSASALPRPARADEIRGSSNVKERVWIVGTVDARPSSTRLGRPRGLRRVRWMMG